MPDRRRRERQRGTAASSAYVNSVQAFWSKELPGSARAVHYTLSKTVFFSGQTSAGLRPGRAEVGPFYCPDRQGSTSTSASSRSCARSSAPPGGPFAQAYVIAHEYGHHVQDLRASLADRQEPAGAAAQSVRTELQADCFAGVWASHAAQTGFLEPSPRRHRRRPGRRGRGGRRPHPEGDPGQRGPGVVDPPAPPAQRQAALALKAAECRFFVSVMTLLGMEQ